MRSGDMRFSHSIQPRMKVAKYGPVYYTAMELIKTSGILTILNKRAVCKVHGLPLLL